MNHFNGQHEDAEKLWDAGKGFEAGKIVFESLASSVRPLWAANILRLIVDRSGMHLRVVDEALRLAQHPDEWFSGHKLFTSIRSESLVLDGARERQGLTSEEELIANILSVAELVAKVTYNAIQPLDEFDEDSGWWIGACLRAFVDHIWNDAEFFKRAKDAVLNSTP